MRNAGTISFSPWPVASACEQGCRRGTWGEPVSSIGALPTSQRIRSVCPAHVAERDCRHDRHRQPTGVYRRVRPRMKNATEWFDLKTPASPRRRARRRRAAGSPSRPWALCPLPISRLACRSGGYSERDTGAERQGIGRHYAALTDRAARCHQSREHPVRTSGMR